MLRPGHVVPINCRRSRRIYCSSERAGVTSARRNTWQPLEERNEAISRRSRTCQLVIHSRPGVMRRLHAIASPHCCCWRSAEGPHWQRRTPQRRPRPPMSICYAVCSISFLWVWMTLRRSSARRAFRSRSRTSPPGRRSPTKPPPDTGAAGSKRLFWSGIPRERPHCPTWSPSWIGLALPLSSPSAWIRCFAPSSQGAWGAT